jgi:hypothetical protein
MILSVERACNSDLFVPIINYFVPRLQPGKAYWMGPTSRVRGTSDTVEKYLEGLLDSDLADFLDIPLRFQHRPCEIRPDCCYKPCENQA